MDCHVIQKEILGKRISVEFMFGESLFISLFSQLMLFCRTREGQVGYVVLRVLPRSEISATFEHAKVEKY